MTKMTDDKMRFRELLGEPDMVRNDLCLAWYEEAHVFAAMSRAYELDRGVDEGAIILAAQAAANKMVELDLRTPTGGPIAPRISIKQFIEISKAALLAAFPNAKEPGE